MLLISDKDLIANQFNNLFTNIGLNIFTNIGFNLPKQIKKIPKFNFSGLLKILDILPNNIKIDLFTCLAFCNRIVCNINKSHTN